MKTRIMIREGQYRLNKAGCMDPKIDAEELYCYLTGTDKVELFLKNEEEVDPEVERKYAKLIERRASRVPLQHITGEQEFMGYTFAVDPDVLIPRQDTETLVENAAKVIRNNQREKRPLLERLRGRKEWGLLDLCCGSGIVGISIAKICGNVDLTGCDISEKAVALAKKNAQSLHVSGEFLQGDLFAPVVGNQFDMIVANPPYIRTNMIAMLQEEIKDHEPREALDGGRDGLTYYRKIIQSVNKYLTKDGFLLMEIGYDQGDDVRKMVEDSRVFKDVEVLKDLPGRDRVVLCSR